MAGNQGVTGLPRSVFVADGRLYRKISESPAHVELLDDLDTMIVPLAGKIEVHESAVGAVRARLFEAGQLNSGALLIKNPYDAESYEFADRAIETFASAKYHALANLTRLLGARSVRFVEVKADRDRTGWVAKAKARIPAGGGEIDATREVTRKLEKRLEGEMAFPGATPDIAGAETYLQERNLMGDHQMRDLIDPRTGDNPIRKYKMTVSGTRESASSFDSALKLANTGPVKALDVGASFRVTAESIRSITLTTEITF